jgi:RNA polymerase sigma factor (sigma-70 family)
MLPMTSGIIDESAIADALRLSNAGERAKQILNLQGLGLWHGDLSEMRRDSPRSPAAEPTAPSANAREVTRRMAMVRRVGDALNRLPPQGREALYLRYYESLPIEEIAGRFGMTAPWAEELLSEALGRVTAIYVETADKLEKS